MVIDFLSWISLNFPPLIWIQIYEKVTRKRSNKIFFPCTSIIIILSIAKLLFPCYLGILYLPCIRIYSIKHCSCWNYCHVVLTVVIILVVLIFGYICPGWCGSVDWVLAYEPNARWFDRQSGHIPGMRARSQVGGVQEATTRCFSLFRSTFPSV